MVEKIETLAGRLRVSPGPKEQVGRSAADLLRVVNAVESGIREFDKVTLGESASVAPESEIGAFLEGAYAVTRYIVGEEPTHPMLEQFRALYGKSER